MIVVRSGLVVRSGFNPTNSTILTRLLHFGLLARIYKLSEKATKSPSATT